MEAVLLSLPAGEEKIKPEETGSLDESKDLIVNGRINGTKAKIFIDGGSQVDLAASRLVDKAKLATTRSRGGLTVQLAGGQMQDASVETQPVGVQLSGW